ncbi:transporter substrate-binding domain-containing protein [Vibrio profundum]|uniref:substrate-binding periplasmic protein n=1 Tax=Vibrio profundum TaxID=2910247 RepID=UPI003D0D53A0
MPDPLISAVRLKKVQTTYCDIYEDVPLITKRFRLVGARKKGGVANLIILFFYTSIVIFSLSSLLNKAYPSNKNSLTVAVSPWIPWRIQLDDGSWGGIAIDTIKVIALCTKTNLELLDVKNAKRMRKEWGRRINAESAISPLWRKSQESSSSYTNPLFTTSDIIFAKKGKFKSIVSSKDLHGEEIGVTVGYYYPEGFTEAFNTGKILTSPSNSKTLLPKLLRGRLKVIIINENELLYLLSNNQYNFKYEVDDFEVIYRFETVPLHIRLHRDYEHLVPKFNAVIDQMNSSGLKESIQRKYSTSGRGKVPRKMEDCPFKPN